MQILVVDNNIMPESWGASELCRLSRLARGATIHVRRAPQGDLPRDPRAFDRIVVSGSKTGALEQAPWIDSLEEFLRRAVDGGTPVFGICYGHQTLARILGGRGCLREQGRGEFGWGRIELTEAGQASSLMKGLPASFHSFQWHNDEVTELPRHLRLLARSESCPVQAFELPGRPVFGIQFHPERNAADGERSIARRLELRPDRPMLNAGLGPKLHDPAIGETLFRNFLSLESSE